MGEARLPGDGSPATRQLHGQYRPRSGPAARITRTAGRWPNRHSSRTVLPRRLAAHPQHAALACANSIRRGQQAAIPLGPPYPAAMAWPAVTATETVQGGPLVRLHTHVCAVSPAMTVAVSGELDMESGPGLCDELTCMIWANGPIWPSTSPA